MQLQSEQINEIALALSKCQAEMTFATKDSSNPFFKSKYADLASVWGACRGPMVKNDLSVLQQMTVENDKPYLVTTLAHKSGQWFRSMAPLNPVKNDPQGLGSAITYMRRYTLSALIGVIQDDDDGEASMNRSGKVKYEAPKMQIASQVSAPVHVITSFEAEELRELLDACSSEFQEKINDYMIKTLKINSIQSLPSNLFIQMKSRFYTESKKTGTEE